MSTDGIDYLGPIITDAGALKREAVRRRKAFEEKSVDPAISSQFEEQGWKKADILKRSVKLIKEKAFDERLENRFWMLLFRMGYPELNKGRGFQIRIERRGADALSKQIDVFAKDDETVIIAECKACERISKRSLQKDIEEFANLKGPIANSVRAHYGMDKKLKVIWLFVTENIIWSKPDKDRAAGENIRVITEKELRYFSQIADHLGRAARYQFLAEFLRDMEIPGLANAKVPAIKGKLGGKVFYCFSTTPRHLLKIAFVNHRSLSDPEGAPAYQRLVSRSRLRDIETFIKNGGFFPNNLLINFTRELRFERIAQDEANGVIFGMLYLPARYRSAWVIDGQHRLYGFSRVDDKLLDQNIIVVGFERLPKVEEANLFVTINHEQKSVPKHLLDDLEGELKWESTIPSERIGAIASRLINFLNADIDEPFYNRVTQQGIKSTSKTCLTIPAIKEALIRSGLLGKSVLKDSIYEPGPFTGRTDTETLDRARDALNQYFKFISAANQLHWEKGRDGYVSTNVGVQAYILLLRELIKYWEMITGSDAKQATPAEMLDDIEEYLDPVVGFLSEATDEQMKEKFTVVLGGSGPVEYFYKLCQLIKTQLKDFNPDGLERFEAEQSDERFNGASLKLREMEMEVNRLIFDVLKVRHGAERDSYWEDGVPDNNIKADAYKRSLEDSKDKRGPVESYLNVVDYKKIIDHKQNWPVFKRTFNIPERGEKGHAKNLKWLDRLNELRRIPSHPSPERRFKIEDYEYIDWLYQELMSKIKETRREGIETLLKAAEPSSTEASI